MSAKIIIEGSSKGPDSKYLQARLREAFRRLLIEGRPLKKPDLVAGGSRGDAYKLFKTAHAHAQAGNFVALLVDSEEPVEDIERTWRHVNARDGWDKPAGANDEQILLMTTCMETWIASDRQTLRQHYGAKLQETALPVV